MDIVNNRDIQEVNVVNPAIELDSPIVSADVGFEELVSNISGTAFDMTNSSLKETSIIVVFDTVKVQDSLVVDRGADSISEDNLGTSDNFNIVLSKIIRDNVTQEDSVVTLFSKKTSDSAEVSDIVGFTISKNIYDTVALSDAFEYAIANPTDRSDSFGLEENLYLQLSKHKTDIVTATTQLSINFLKISEDNVSINEETQWAFSKIKQEIAIADDNLLFQVNKSLVSSNDIADYTSFNLLKLREEIITALSLLNKNINKNISESNSVTETLSVFKDDYIHNYYTTFYVGTTTEL